MDGLLAIKERIFFTPVLTFIEASRKAQIKHGTKVKILASFSILLIYFAILFKDISFSAVGAAGDIVTLNGY